MTKLPRHPLVLAVKPIVEQLGASLVAAEDREPGDLPLKWEGVVIAAVRPAPLHGALDRLIESVEREMGAPLPSLSREEKQKAIRLLDDRGAFILRRAVEDVADAMGVSRITVYNYLNAPTDEVLGRGGGRMTGQLVVVPYDPQWPHRFEEIAASLRDALGALPVVAIEHVGSTSVPDLAAKPVIDVDVVVTRDIVRAAVAAIASAGYEPLGEMGVPDRFAFRSPVGAPRQNIYVTVVGSLALRNHLGLRDTLRACPDLRDEYGAVKLALAARTDDIDVYVDGKTDIVLRILQKVGLAQHELDELEGVNRMVGDSVAKARPR